YGFVLWLPSIIRSGGENMGMVEVGWLSSVPYLAATIFYATITAVLYPTCSAAQQRPFRRTYVSSLTEA
ncbi:hypothetical protein, partial [Klebsiella pneumoniae]|uniref:hypothetical protein n=1 Tax=Klebsiella pneumoniae TaxID=573 RepID=UPI000F1F4A64